MSDHNNNRMHHRFRLACFLGITVLLSACSEPPAESETLDANYQGRAISVTFRGERSSEELFGPGGTLAEQVTPLTQRGRPEGELYNPAPNWLDFDYQVNGEQTQLLLAKEPIMNQVSWLGIARAGAALGDDSVLRFQGLAYPQNARVTDINGREYRLRLLTCGRSTMAHLSEWNLLIGGVHQGDMDFKGDRYGWIRQPYDNQDLKVGLEGSLSWCQEDWQNPGTRVARGYYFVSRFHAAPANTATDRLFWRPALELIQPEPKERPLPSGVQVAPDGRLVYLGRKANADLFGPHQSIADSLNFLEGERLGSGEPDWLMFEDEGTVKLVASKPIAHSLSWQSLAQAGLVGGNDSSIRLGAKAYPQDTVIEDEAGHRYQVRLLQCGNSTLDHTSEWNRLIGAVVQPDEDFAQYSDLYGWIEHTLRASTLNIGTQKGAASWCQEQKNLYGIAHGVNRGYLVPSRYHATDIRFTGWGFSWRPVLERIED